MQGAMTADTCVVDPLLIDSAAVRWLKVKPVLPERIEDLNFVPTLQIDTRVGSFWDFELNVELTVAVLILRVHVRATSLRSFEPFVSGVGPS